jgi:hypothetical protein
MHQSKRFQTDEEHAAALHKAYAARDAQPAEAASLPLDAQVGVQGEEGGTVSFGRFWSLIPSAPAAPAAPAAHLSVLS